MYLGNWTEKLARACARRPWVTIGIWVAVIAAAVMMNVTWLSDALVTDAEPYNDPESMVGYDLMNERLGNSTEYTLEEMIIVHSGKYTVDDPEFADQVQQIFGEVAALGEEAFLGGATYYMTQDQGMVSAERDATIIAFTMTSTGDEYVEQLYEIGKHYSNDDFTVYHTGSASMAHDMIEIGESSMVKGEMIGLSAAIIILAVVFGALAAAFLPILLGGVAIMVALGLAALVGQAMELTFMIQNMVTMMGLAVGIDYSLFILTRFREERAKGLEKVDAIGRAGATANRAVFFSGLTVVLALSGLVIFPLSIFVTMGIGAILVVIMAIAGSMTLLPALISLLGDRVNRFKVPWIGKANAAPNYERATGFWAWITRVVTRVPVASLILAVTLLLVAATPFLDKESGMSGIEANPDYLKSKEGYLFLQEKFHIGLDTPVTIVIDGDVTSPEVQEGIETLQTSLSGESALAGTFVAHYHDLNMVIVYGTLAGDSMSKASMDAVEIIRTDYIPQAFGENRPVDVYVTGESAFILDFNITTSNYTPWIMAFVLALSFIILLLAFRSLVISFTAIIMNLLSVGAAYGLVVLVFQKGFGVDFFGFQQVEFIETWLPLFLFALLFGLSMDYQVFLLSRVRERYMQTGDSNDAVAFGLRSTGRLITGAALIMVAVFGGFALGDLAMMQQMGFGLAVAIFLDATLVRCVLVPATMTMLGKRNWYLPRWLQWIPNVSLGEQPVEGKK